MRDFNKQIKDIDLTGFKIVEINKTPQMTLIKATRFAPVYFAFYDHFIVCSGDYGEWVFDCTWKTNEKQLPENMLYLLGKLSRQCKKTIFNESLIEQNFEELKNNFLEAHDVHQADYDPDLWDSIQDTFENFYYALRCTDEYRIVPIVDEYAEQICDLLGINEETEDWIDFYNIGDDIHSWLITNLAMLNKLRELNALFEYQGGIK